MTILTTVILSIGLTVGGFYLAYRRTSAKMRSEIHEI